MHKNQNMTDKVTATSVEDESIINDGYTVVRRNIQRQQEVEDDIENVLEDLESESDNEPVRHTLTGLNGKELVVLNHRLDEEEYPALGAVSPRKKSTKLKRYKNDNTRAPPVSFIVASSRIDELRAEHQSQYRMRTQTERDRAFARLENKEELSRSLQHTKACKHVTEEKDKTGRYGVCYREICTFAHSLEEFNDPLCSFGDECRHIRGRKDRRTGQFDETKKCMFRHPTETREEYHTRTGKILPDLPPTFEHTRQPRPKRVRRPKSRPEIPRTPAGTPEAKPQVRTLGAPRKPKIVRPVNIPKLVLSEEDTTEEERVIRVPEAMFGKAMELAITQGLTKFRIETY